MTPTCRCPFILECPQFEHVAQHADAPRGEARQELQRGDDRGRAGVVAIVQDRDVVPASSRNQAQTLTEVVEPILNLVPGEPLQ